MPDDLQVRMRVIVDLRVATIVAGSGDEVESTRSFPGRIIAIHPGPGDPDDRTIDVMLDDGSLHVRVRRAQVRPAVPDDVIDNVRSAADPAIAAQALDARLARQAKQLRELGHIAEQTRVAASADVDRITLIRKRLRSVFPDLPAIDGADGPPPRTPTHICHRCGERITYGEHANGCT